MSMSKELATYGDVKAVLDRVLQQKEQMYYKLPTFKAAMRWRYRMYHYRALLRKQEAIRLGLPNIQMATPYDALQCVAIDAMGTLLIKFNEVEGKLSDAKGNSVDVKVDLNVPATVQDADAELIAELKSSVEKLGKDPL
jgi:hypothetical protein